MPSSLILELLYPGSVDARVWLDAFTPILSKQYWYFSSYFVLFLFMPFLKQLIHALDAVRLRQLAVTLVLCFSLLPLFMSGDVFSVASGYSPLWLIALYLLGACLRRLDGERRGRRRYLLWYLLAVTAAWAGKLALDAWNLSGSPPIPHFNSMLVLSYLSPFLLAFMSSTSIQLYGNTVFIPGFLFCQTQYPSLWYWCKFWAQPFWSI